MTLVQETCELDRLALDVSSPGQKVMSCSGSWSSRQPSRLGAGSRQGSSRPAHRVGLSVNQLQVTAGSLGYTPVTPLDSVVGHACLLSPNPARLSVALPGRGGVRSGLLRFSQISHRST